MSISVKKTRRTLAWLALALLLASTFGALPARAQSTIYVEPSGNCSGTPCHTTIQNAVDNATAGDTIQVEEGTYNEQLTIDKSLTLMGDEGDATAGPGANPPILDSGGVAGDAITIQGGVSDVTIAGFEIRNYKNDGNAGVGSGISAWNATPNSNITIRDNDFHDLGWNAVLVGNDGQALHDNWLVQDNVVERCAVYSIELTNAKNSSVIGNQVTGGENVLGQGNDTMTGIVVATLVWTGSGLSSSNVTVEGNTVTGPLGTAGIWVVAADYTKSVPAVLDGVTVSQNSVSGVSGVSSVGDPSAGIHVYCSDGTGASVKNLTIQDNDLDGNQDGVFIRDKQGAHGAISVTGNEIVNNTGSGAHVEAGTSAANITVDFNNIVGNDTYGANNEGVGTLDAEDNWWGAASGPLHDVAGTDCEPPSDGGWNCDTCNANADGKGDQVTGTVDYCPWSGAAVDGASVGTGANATATTDGASAQGSGGDTDTKVTIVKYGSDPTGGDPGSGLGGPLYYRVQVEGAQPSQLVVELNCPGGRCTGMVMRWFDGASWHDVDPQRIINGAIRATLNDTDSTPRISQLDGTYFAIGLAQPVGGTTTPARPLRVVAPLAALTLVAMAVGAALIRRRRPAQR